jgi:hypothetical protein
MKQTEKYVFGFAKQTENQPKQIEFRFVSVRTENNFCLFQGHPTIYALTFELPSRKCTLYKCYINQLK